MRVLLASTLAIGAVASTAQLPIVDLGYQRHQAIDYNTTGKYYTFSNIRYAQPPVGSLRFAAPVAPQGHNRSHEVVDGSGEAAKCPQSVSCWFLLQTELSNAVLAGDEIDFEASYTKQYADGACEKAVSAADRDPTESEDCLFLDVIVPESILQNKNASRSSVLVYFQDGAYTAGAKSDQNAAGLIEQSRADGGEGIIYVGFNYRLGVMGWMSGPKFESQGGLPNAALYDQRLLLGWIQRNIHRFGGDPGRVTVMGESSGGSSILTQVTAYGKSLRPPFQQVITQSPAWEPATKNATVEDDLFDQFLSYLNVSSLDEARRLPSQDIIDANYRLVSSLPYGKLILGPAIDGTFIPTDPKRLLASGKVSPHIRALTTYTSNEGFALAPFNITDDAAFNRYVAGSLHIAPPSVVSHVTDVLYPPIFDGSQPYKTQHGRANLFWSELVTSCNTRYLQSALYHHHNGSKPLASYATEYSVYPGTHMSDTSSIFYTGGEDATVNATVATTMQSQIVRFVQQLDPQIEEYDGRNVYELGDKHLGLKKDLTDNARCEYWRSAPYLA